MTASRSEPAPSSATTAPCRQAEGIAAPACCQAPLTPEWHAAYVDRVTRQQTQLRAVTPRRCPNCGAGVRALYWRVSRGRRRLDVYGCVRLECHTVISGRGD